MLKFKQETILEPILLKKEDFFEFEKVLFDNMEETEYFIYNVYAGADNLEIGPENSMADFIKHEELFGALNGLDEFYISINYSDNKNTLYVRFSEQNTLLSIKSTDDEWLVKKLEQIVEFLKSRGLSQLQAQIYLSNIILPQIKRDVPVKSRYIDKIFGVILKIFLAVLTVAVLTALITAAIFWISYRY